MYGVAHGAEDMTAPVRKKAMPNIRDEKSNSLNTLWRRRRGWNVQDHSLSEAEGTFQPGAREEQIAQGIQ